MTPCLISYKYSFFKKKGGFTLKGMEFALRSKFFTDKGDKKTNIFYSFLHCKCMHSPQTKFNMNTSIQPLQPLLSKSMFLLPSSSKIKVFLVSKFILPFIFVERHLARKDLFYDRVKMIFNTWQFYQQFAPKIEEASIYVNVTTTGDGHVPIHVTIYNVQKLCL